MDTPAPPIANEKGLPELEADTTNILPEGATDPIYLAKAKIINDALQEIGMGKYQWHLFGVAGFGWMMDNMWPIITSLIFTPVVNELHPSRGPFLQLAQNIGLLVGAFCFGLGSDIFGRRWAFNLTLLITGTFGLISGSSPNFTAIAVFAALWSIGVGGNLPVDSAVFLEFIPGRSQYLLTILSIYWAFGQLLATLIAWALLTNFSCSDAIGACPRSENMGWRYFMFTMGGITLICFVLRFFVFHLHETPKFLMSRGHDAEAVDVIQKVALYNGSTTSLRSEHLTSLSEKVEAPAQDTSAMGAVRRRFEKFSASHVRELFKTPQMAWSTSLIVLIWALIGLAFPLYNAFLPYLLATRGADTGNNSTYITYRNEVIIAVLGIPGALAGGLLVELPKFGRKGALCVSTVITGVFLFGSTTAKTSNSLLGWNCGYNFTSNIMYAVLYAYTPEIFPARDRGTGTGLAATANRIFGIMSPIVAMYADLNTPVPVYVSGALFIVAGLLVILLPYEPRGKASI
ncbi:MFS general substrate transporter [Calocera viscosa TUFC12733]|uniref:MFS general substrate transporter n=1 Tax=Calocera viscosa (strain TUFC12733) TaxID=1330018 RepID=A0A167PKF0_CALVF|nr:MFS general substrate transporter [Calocera viscosa TUFC12733]